MVKLTDMRPLLEFELPSYPGSIVKARKGILVGQQMKISEKYPNASDPKSPDAQNLGMEVIIQCIEERNFEGDDGQVLPINLENLYKLPQEDLLFLVSKITPTAEKKS